jgi:hypothetical protein
VSELRIGYHYTPCAKWPQIERDGLVPQRVVHPDIVRQFPKLRATWLWPEMEVGDAHLGNLMRQVAVHCSTRTALLEVRYRSIDVFRPDLIFDHSAAVGDWVYHVAEPGILIMRRVPPSRLRVLGIYDLALLLEPSEGISA